jgi:DNA-binding LytR/AlgR family response regulator
MKPNDPQHLRINAEVKLEPHRIVYMQSAANYTYVHTFDKRFLSSRTLKVLNDRLLTGSFLKIRRGLIVNSLYIAEINDDKYDPFVQLISGKRFAISRRLFLEVTGRVKK